jgi:hypothetical protein
MYSNNKQIIRIFFICFGLYFLMACAGLTNKGLEKDKNLLGKSASKPIDFVIEQDNANVSIDGKVYEPDPEEQGYSVLKLNGGVIESFNGDIGDWWTGEGGRLSLEKQGGALKVNAKKVGPKYDAFGRPYNGFDFASEPVALKVRARAEGAKAPLLWIALKDANGYTTNAKPETKRIAVGDQFTDYYFRYDYKLRQSFPEEKLLDAKSITTIMFFINPGSSAYTGTLYIDEVKAVPASEAAKAPVVVVAGAEGGMLDNFEDGISTWWDNPKLKADSPDGKSLRVTSDKAGPAYEAFGRSFDPFNFTEFSTVRVKAKVESDAVPNVRLDLKDPADAGTNARPCVVAFDKGNEWADYYFNFKGRFTQTFPSFKKVDQTQIGGLLFFINAGKSPWSGKITIKEIEVVKPVAQEQKAMAGGKVIEESPSTLPGVVIDNFQEGVDSWWMGSDKYTLTSINEKIMQIGCKDIGADYETFGKGFGAMDFTKTPIVVIRAMVDGEAPLVRTDVKDADGHVANISPIIQKFNNDGKFADYFYDYRGKFSQTYPDVQTVNPAQIQEVLFFINPGGPKVNTNIYVEDIKALTPEEYENAIKK